MAHSPIAVLSRIKDMLTDLALCILRVSSEYLLKPRLLLKGGQSDFNYILFPGHVAEFQ